MGVGGCRCDVSGHWWARLGVGVRGRRWALVCVGRCGDLMGVSWCGWAWVGVGGRLWAWVVIDGCGWLWVGDCACWRVLMSVGERLSVGVGGREVDVKGCGWVWVGVGGRVWALDRGG